MRILIVTQYFWPEDFRINDLALGLRQRGHDVVVLTGKPNYPQGHFYPGYGFLKHSFDDFHGTPVIRVPLSARGQKRGIKLVANYACFAFFGMFLGPIRCRGKFDIVFSYEPSPVTVGLPGLVMKYAKRAPLVFWVQDLWPDSLLATGAVKSPLALSLVGKLVRFIYRHCDRILVQSEGFVGPVVAAGAEPGRVTYFPNWAEGLYHPVDPAGDLSERREMPAGFRLMFAGNIGTAQSFETILTAAERLKGYNQLRWVILGDGHRRKWLEEQIKVRGLVGTVFLLGRRPVETMPRYFALADALLVTLKRDPIFALTVPSKIQSYLACAKPVLAALDGEGARVIERSGGGLTCPAEDARALADTALALYRLPEAERIAMGERGRVYFQAHFEREMLLGRLEAWFRDLVKEARCVS